MAHKIKTHSGAKKRFKVTKAGKVKYSKAFRRHLLTKKDSDRKRSLRKSGYLGNADRHKILPLMPY